MELSKNDLLGLKQSCERLLVAVQDKEEFLFSDIAFYYDDKNYTCIDKILFGTNEENKLSYPINKTLTCEILQTMIRYYQTALDNFTIER